MTHRFVVPGWARLGAAAVVAAVVLSGCTGAEPDPGPTGATATSPTASATESPTATEEPTETSALPPLPEEATENTPEGAEAFIRYYVEVANAALTRPEQGLIPMLAHEDCQSCVTMEQQVRDLVSKGDRATDPPYSVRSMERVGGTSEGLEMFNMALVLNETAIEAADGTVGQSSVEEEMSGTGAAIWSEGSWRILDFDLQPSS